MVIETGFLKAIIYHKRHQHKTHSFKHKVFFLILNITNLKNLNKLKFLSFNKFNLFSIFWKNYGFAQFKDPIKYIKKVLKNSDINLKYAKTVILVTMPQMLGYAFNPISFWMCFNVKDELSIVLAEVNNTFGQRHGYLCFNKDFTPIKKFHKICKSKLFHVSPFCEIIGDYDFRFNIDAKKIDIDINYHKDKEMIISTSIRGVREDYNDKNLMKYFFIYPLMTFKVMFLIHFHAMCLWVKRVKYFRKPNKPTNDIS